MFNLQKSKHYKLGLVIAGTIALVVFMYVKVDEAAIVLPKTNMWIGNASWYSEVDPGINPHTANNEIFNDKELTCAIWDIPFNQFIKVTNLENGKSVVVRVNDRGPHRRFVNQGRIIDLTKTAFNQIASLQNGLIRVSLEFL